MAVSFKPKMRELVPIGLQVPLKYSLDKVRGFAEPEMRLLHHLFAKGDRVVDVGANRGVYTYHCWKLGAVVEAFEPNPACTRVLEAWAARKVGVRLHPVGLSNSTGAARLHIPVDAAGTEHDASASIEGHAFEDVRDQPIQLRTLDSFGFSDLEFVKIDVEGHESKVIDGAGDTIGSSRPALLIEIEQRHLTQPIDQIFQQVAHYGYRGFFLENGVLKALEAFESAHHQNLSNFGGSGAPYINNFFFLHEKRIQSGSYKTLPCFPRI